MYTSQAALGQASEQELAELKRETAARPAAGGGKMWWGIAALAAFLLVLYRGGPPRGLRRMGKASW